MHPDDTRLPTDSQMKAMHTFTTAVLAALNEAKVALPGATTHAALLALIGGDGPEDPPVGGSFNFDQDTKVWTFLPELLLSSPADGSDG